MVRPDYGLYEDWYWAERRFLGLGRPAVWVHFGRVKSLPLEELEVDCDAETGRLVIQAWRLRLLLAALGAIPIGPRTPSEQPTKVAPMVGQLVRVLTAAPAAPPARQVALLAA